MSDTFLYYHCVKTSTYSDTYTCRPFSDPLRIPIPADVESRVIPIRQWLPRTYHRWAIQRQLAKSIDVHLVDVLHCGIRREK